jgi:hypothetical protein
MWRKFKYVFLFSGFIVIVSLSAKTYVEYRRAISASTNALVNDAKTDRATVQCRNIRFFKYDGAILMGEFLADSGVFFSPGKAVFQGDVRSFEYDDEATNSDKHLRAEELEVKLRVSGLMELWGSAGDTFVEKAWWRRDVRFKKADLLLNTELVEYDASLQSYRGDLPVEVNSPRGAMTAANGFLYSELTQELEMFGPVEGTYGRP